MPVELGCNYSVPLLQLLTQHVVDVDWIKLSQPETVDEDLVITRPLRPVLLHMLPTAGSSRPVWDAYNWNALERQLQQAGSPHIALHLDLLARDWDEPMDPEDLSPATSKAALARLISGVRAVQERAHVPVLVENMPYYGPSESSSGRLRLVVQPETIWQVTEGTGAGLLLDASHLRCAAPRLGVDVHAYAQSLPLEAVRELHVVGPLSVPGLGLRDRHQPMQDEDYALLAWLLERTAPDVVTLEYGGMGPHFEGRNDPQMLREQLQRLRVFLAGIQ
jgi:uncharacterized protein